VYWVLLKRREERFSLSFALVGLNFNPTNQNDGLSSSWKKRGQLRLKANVGTYFFLV